MRVNFDKISETKEQFDPDGQVTRSTQSVNSTSKSAEANGTTVTAQNNLPNADTGNETSGSQEARQEETTNYEISKTVRTLIREQPQIDRISIAVMVDGTDSLGATASTRGAALRRRDGPDHRPGEDRRSGSMRSVAIRWMSSACGYLPGGRAGRESGGLLGMRLDKADLLHLAQTAVFGVIGVLALLLVLRPMVLRVITSVAPVGVGVGGTASWLAWPGRQRRLCRGRARRPWRQAPYRRNSRTKA